MSPQARKYIADQLTEAVAKAIEARAALFKAADTALTHDTRLYGQIEDEWKKMSIQVEQLQQLRQRNNLIP